MEEIKDPKDKLLTELEEVLVEALFEPQQVRTIVDMHRTLKVEAIQKSIDEYRAHKENLDGAIESAKARQAEIEEGVRRFEERTIDAVNKILAEDAAKHGDTYTPMPNEHRGNSDKSNPDDE